MGDMISTSDLTRIQDRIRDLNQKNGFREEWDEVVADAASTRARDLIVSEKIGLIMSEGAEALEAHRAGVPDLHYLKADGSIVMEQEHTRDYMRTPLHKPDGAAVELADVIIRAIDLIDMMGYSTAKLIDLKMAYNETRPRKHGKKF